jgi:hypothetical protein
MFINYHSPPALLNIHDTQEVLWRYSNKIKTRNPELYPEVKQVMTLLPDYHDDVNERLFNYIDIIAHEKDLSIKIYRRLASIYQQYDIAIAEAKKDAINKDDLQQLTIKAEEEKKYWLGVTMHWKKLLLERAQQFGYPIIGSSFL